MHIQCVYMWFRCSISTKRYLSKDCVVYRCAVVVNIFKFWPYVNFSRKCEEAMDNINQHLLQMLLLSFVRGNVNISLETYFYKSHIDGKSCQFSGQVFLAKGVKSGIGCTSKCTAVMRCNSVFYNKDEASCEGCGDRYNESSGLLDRVGTKYYSGMS